MLKPGRARHRQISDWLRQQIDAGVYEPDDRLPSESELGKRFDVSRVTVRRALQTLESEGRIYRRQGLGSFVKEPRLEQGLVRLTDFAQDMAEAGLEASSRVVLHEQQPVPPEVASRLGLEEQTTVVRLDRLRLGDGEPVAFDRTWLPLFYGQLIDDFDLEHETIYGILEREHEIPVLRGHYHIESVNADQDLARQLDVLNREALLLIERLSLTEADRPIYFQRRFYRTDRVAYELELARDPDRRASSKHGHPLRRLDPVFKPLE